MPDLIAFIHARLDRLELLPLGFAVVLGVAVLATAVFQDAAAPATGAALDPDLTTTAAAVP